METSISRLANVTTISSLQVAEATGKAHNMIMRDIRNILDQGVDECNFALTSYTDKANRQSPCYQLTKKGCLILASGYNAKLREQIIDRWEELETQAAQTTLNFPAQTLDTVERLHKALCDARETIDRQNNILDEKSRIISDMERMASLLDPDHKSFTSSVDFQFVVDCITRLLRLELVKAERVEVMEGRISKLERSMKEKGGEI